MQDFWNNNGDKVLVGVITAIVVLLLSEWIKALFKKLGSWIETGFQALGFGFEKRYYHALNENHQWLKLIGIYNPADLHAPRLREVFISLRMNTAKDSPAVTWDHIFNGAEKHMVIVGQPGAGKSTLLDYLTLVLTGYIPHPLREGLGQAGIQVHGEAGGQDASRLLQAVAESVVLVADRGRRTNDGGQAVGGIVGVGVEAIKEQVAILIPVVGDPIRADQAIRGIVLRTDDCGLTTDRHGLAQAVADLVVGVLVVTAIRVAGLGQAVERIVKVSDIVPELGYCHRAGGDRQGGLRCPGRGSVVV